LDASILEAAIHELIVHHDVLRARYIGSGAETQQIIAAPSRDDAPVRRRDLSALDDHEQQRGIQELAEELQRSLNIIDGPILQVAYVDLGAKPADRLLVVIHHLVVDAVSWRILLEDLETACLQLVKGQTVRLPAKTTSFRRWSQRLTDYAQTQAVQEEQGHWLALGEVNVLPLPIDKVGNENTVATVGMVRRELAAKETGALLREVSQAYNTEINDLLLTALSHAFAKWTGRRELFIEVEGHGREALFDDVDISRTVGWFTTIFPVLLRLPPGGDPGEDIIAVKEQLRAIPVHGMNYGVLRYLNRQHALRERLVSLPEPQVLFLYLGRFDQGLGAEDTIFASAEESTGLERSEKGRRRHLLEITAVVAGDQLQLLWRYNSAIHRRTTIEMVADEFTASLRALIAQCKSAEASRFTPSDFPAARLTQKSFDQLAMSLGKSREKAGHE
jgi:non-ribosomal peptide synthase protein (TIGR01720 family)